MKRREERLAGKRITGIAAVCVFAMCSYTVATAQVITSSSPDGWTGHIYTVLTPEVNNIAYHPGLDLLVFIHRNADKLFGGNTAQYRVSYSTDRGLSWASDLGPITVSVSNVQGDIAARFPQVLIYNPPGNARPDSAWIVYLGSFHDQIMWRGVIYGTARLVDISSTKTQDTLWILRGQTYIYTGLTWGRQDTFWSVGVELNGDFNTQLSFGDSLVLIKGWVQQSGSAYTASVQPQYIPITLFELASHNIDFSPSGDTGWVVLLADIDRTMGDKPTFEPVVLYTTDGGTTWSTPQEIELSTLNIPFLPASLILVDQSGNPVDTLDTTDYSTVFEADVLVDKQGRAHIFTGVTFGVDSYTILPAYTQMVDIVIKIGAGGVAVVDTVLWLDSLALGQMRDSLSCLLETDNILTQDFRPQLSGSADGSVIAAIWGDMDTAGGKQQAGRDLKVALIDAVNDSVVQRGNVTAFDAVWSGRGHFHSVAQDLISVAPPTCNAYLVPVMVPNVNPLSREVCDTLRFYSLMISTGSDVPTVTANTKAPSCPGGSDGWIKVIVSGGTGPFTHRWNTGATGDSIYGLPAGTYVDTIRSGCVQIVLRVELSDPLFMANAVCTNTDPGRKNGAVLVSVTGGTSPFLFIWSTGDTTTTNRLLNLDTGTYWVMVVDANGCRVSDTCRVGLNPATAVEVPTDGGQLVVISQSERILVFTTEPIEEIHLVDLAGAILRRAFTGNGATSGQYTYTISTTNLPAGVYILQVRQKGKIHSVKYIREAN